MLLGSVGILAVIAGVLGMVVGIARKRRAAESRRIPASVDVRREPVDVYVPAQAEPAASEQAVSSVDASESRAA